MPQPSEWTKMTVHDIRQIPNLITIVDKNGKVAELLKVMRRDYKRNKVWVVKLHD